MWRVIKRALFLIGHPKYFPSTPLPARTWGSAYTCGARWRVWDNTITRFLTKPTRKEITTTGQKTNTNIIAATRSSQKVLYWKNLHEDEVIFRTNLVLYGFDTPGYIEHIFFFNMRKFSKINTNLHVRSLQTCVLAKCPL